VGERSCSFAASVLWWFSHIQQRVGKRRLVEVDFPDFVVTLATQYFDPGKGLSFIVPLTTMIEKVAIA
jgi:hypothetical protein